MSSETGSGNKNVTTKGFLLLGKTTDSGDPVLLPVQVLKRHFMALGGSGSGKTVLCKCVIEEAVRNKIPIIIVDPQGDISSLAVKGDPEELSQHGTPHLVEKEFFDNARITVFTPASNRAIPICINPFKSPSQDVPFEEAVQALDLTATSLAGFLGYDLNSDGGKSAKAYMFTLLEYLWKHRQRISDISQFADMVINPPLDLAGALTNLVPKKEPEEIARKLRFLTVGTSALMFQMGVHIDINLFMDRSDGKTPVNIIYLNTLASENDKQFFLATMLKELYCWMLKNPSNNLQMLFYVDEISPYIPPYPRNPPPKNAYSLLFKQARKYGIGLVAATQNITDIDYKALAQVNTWSLGRMMTSQDIGRVQKIIQSIDPAHADIVLHKLPSLKTGEFLLLSPDVYTDIVDFNVRWLATKHLTLDEKDLAQYITPESKVFFEKCEQTKFSEKGTYTAHSESAIALDERILHFVGTQEKAVTSNSIAESLKISQSEADKTMQKLMKTGVIKKGRNKGDGQQVYWLSNFDLNPSRGITGEVLMINARITQIDAEKKVKPMLLGSIFRKEEEICDVQFKYLPIWKIEAKKERKLLLSKREETCVYYVSTDTGGLVSLERNELNFRKKLGETYQKLKSLDEDPHFIFTPKMPTESDKLPTVRLSKSIAFKTLALKIGVTPIAAELVFIPTWNMRVQHKNKKLKRSISIEAVTGRLLTGDIPKN